MIGANKIKVWVSGIFRSLIVLAIIYSVHTKSWINLLLSVLTLLLTFLPSLLERRLKVDYPDEFEIVILLFIFASIFLGNIIEFYYRFWWWDIMLHTISGVIIAEFAFSLVYILNKEKRVSVHLDPFFVSLFSFCFAVSLGVLWEIFEFLVDSLFGFNMQVTGLNDTMVDLMLNSLGALVISVLGYLYLNGKIDYFSRWERDFLKLNKKFFSVVKRDNRNKKQRC